MKRIFRLLLILPALLLTATACEETDDADDPQYDNWAAHNEAYFAARTAEARAAINAARATYGDRWEDHCDWRIYRSYRQDTTQAATAADSIIVHITTRGTGSGSPLFTDSVRVNFTTRLIPNALATDDEARTHGKIVSYTGVSRDSSAVFDKDFATPTKMGVSNAVEGLTTALLYMHIGDQWRVYIPQQLGNEDNETTNIPPYSTIVYDIQLKAFYRAGTVVPDWK